MRSDKSVRAFNEPQFRVAERGVDIKVVVKPRAVDKKIRRSIEGWNGIPILVI
jgi:hypothetical protein